MSTGLLIALLTTVCISQAVEVNVYFIGNSYTYANGLSSEFKKLAESRLPGTTINIKENSVGGRTLAAAASDAGIASDMKGPIKWDYIVLQDQSIMGGIVDKFSYPERQLSEDAVKDVFSPYAAANGATIVYFQTWGRRYGKTVPFDDYYDMTRSLVWGYGVFADLSERYGCVNTLTARVGELYRKVFNYCGTLSNDPAWDQNLLFWKLYISDGSHPSVTGTYAISLTLFNTIFQKQSGWDDSWYRPGMFHLLTHLRHTLTYK